MFAIENYINISEIAGRVSEMSAGYAVQSWLRDYKTLEFLKLWECKHNPDFDQTAYNELVEKSKESSTTITPKMWIETTKAIGIRSTQGRYGGTFAHPAIACAFMMWISPRYWLMTVETILLTEDGVDLL